MPGEFQIPMFKTGFEIPKLGSSFSRATPFQRAGLVTKAEKAAGELPPTEQELKEKKRPVLTLLTIVGNGLNIPSAMISGLAEQLTDQVPGFSARTYLRRVFNLKDQVSWGDIIENLATRDEKENVWDKEWLQALAGLTLDIVLDPLNFIGFGYVKSLFTVGRKAAAPADAMQFMGQIHKAVGEELLKTGGDAGKVLQRVHNTAYAEAIGARFGIRMPFSQKMLKPFRKLGEPTREILEAGTKKPTQAFIEFAKKRSVKSLLDDFIKKIPVIKGVYKWGKKAFMPYQQAYSEVIEASIQKSTDIMINTKNLLNEITAGKKLPQSVEKLLYQYLDNAGGIAYRDGDLIKMLMHKASLLQDIVTKADDTSTFVAKGFMDDLIKLNKEYKKIFTADMKKLFKTHEGVVAAAKKGMKVEFPVKDFLKITKDAWADFSIRELQATLLDLGYKIDPGLTRGLGETTAQKIVKSQKVPFSESTKEIREILAGMTDDQAAVFNSLADQGRLYLDKWIADELVNGIPVHYHKDYIPRFTMPPKAGAAPLAIGRAKQWFQEARSGKSTKQIRAMIAAQMVNSGFVPIKTTKKAALETAKELLSKGGKEIEAKFGHIIETFSEALWVRGTAHFKAMARKDMIDQMKLYGFAQKGKLIPVGFKAVDHAEFKDLLFDEKTAEYITRTVETVGSDSAIAEFLKFMDAPLNWWKLFATSANPGFHFRNFYSNHFLGWIWQGPGYFKPKNHNIALGMTMKAGGLGKKTALFNKMKLQGIDPLLPTEAYKKVFAHKRTVQDLFDFLYFKGAFRQQFQMSEVATEPKLITGIKKTLKNFNPLSRDGFMAKGGQWIGSHVEAQARVAAFLRDFEKTGSMEMSWRAMEKVMVRYTLTTPFERNVMKKVIPFWTWMSRNTANQFVFIFTQPARYARIPKVKNAIERGVDNKVPKEFQPAYFKDLWMWQLPINLPNGTPLFFNPNFPFQDLNRIKIDMTNPGESMREMTREAMTALSPFIKLPFELLPAKGYDIFRAQELIRYPGYEAPVPGILQPIAHKMAVMFPEISARLGITIDGKIARMNPKLAKAMEEMIPAVNNYARALAIDPTKQNFDHIFKAISYLVGIKVKPLDVNRQRYYYYLDVMKRRKGGY